MEGKECTAYEVIIQLINNPQLVEKPTSDLVIKVLSEYINYIEELTMDLIYCNTAENNFMKYITAPTACNLFHLYTCIRDIFNTSGAWQNVAVTDLANPTPKRTTVILNLFSTFLKQYFMDCLNTVQKFCDQSFALKEEYDNFWKQTDTYNKSNEERINFLAKYEQTNAKLLGKKELLTKQLQLDDQNEENLLHSEINLERGKHLHDKLEALKAGETRSMEEIVNGEDFEDKQKLEETLLERLKVVDSEKSDCDDGLEAKHREYNELKMYLILLKEFGHSQLEEATQDFVNIKSNIQEGTQQFTQMENRIEESKKKKEEAHKNLEQLKAELTNEEQRYSEEVFPLEEKIKLEKTYLCSYENTKISSTEMQKKFHDKYNNNIEKISETTSELETVKQKFDEAMCMLISSRKLCLEKVLRLKNLNNKN